MSTHERGSTLVRMTQLDISEDNVRRHGRRIDLDELAESMKLHDLQQPIVVQQRGERYEILIGQRRFLAAQQLGWEEIEAKILPARLEKLEAIILSFSENTQRRDLSDQDKAAVCKYLLDQLGSRLAVAQRLGVSTMTVSRWLGYDAVPEQVKHLVNEGKLTRALARQIAKISDDEARVVQVAEMTAAQRMTVERMTADEESRFVQAAAEAAPDASIESVLARAREARVQQVITFVLTPQYQTLLEEVAGELSKEASEIAKDATIEWLERNRPALTAVSGSDDRG